MSELRSNRYWRNREPEERVKNTLIPKRYRKDTLDTFKVSAKDVDAMNLINKWVDSVEEQVENGQGLYLVGATGSGKTHLAQAILKRVVYKHNLCGAFVTTNKYLELAYAKNNFGDELPDGYEDPNLMRYLQETYDIVVLDSLGTERITEFTLRNLTTLIESRYHNNLTTIVTSLYTPESLEETHGATIPSILTDCCYRVPLRGSDYRISKWMDANAG